MEQQARWLGRQKEKHCSPLRHPHAPGSLQSVELSEVVRFPGLQMLGREGAREWLCVVLGLLPRELWGFAADLEKAVVRSESCDRYGCCSEPYALILDLQSRLWEVTDSKSSKYRYSHPGETAIAGSSLV